jgi:hypothetical protein
VGALEPLGIFGEPSFHVSGDVPAGSLSADAANPIANLVDCDIAVVGVQNLDDHESARRGANNSF